MFGYNTLIIEKPGLTRILCKGIEFFGNKILFCYTILNMIDSTVFSRGYGFNDL